MADSNPSGPISRVLCPGTRPGRRPSILDGGYAPPPATYPGPRRATPDPALLGLPLRGLAPGEVYPAGRSPDRWGALTRHCTLTVRVSSTPRGGRFLWHSLAGHPDWALPSTLLCGARTFLRQVSLPAPARLAWAPGIEAASAMVQGHTQSPHPERAAYRCFFPDLTGFAVLCRRKAWRRYHRQHP